MSDDDRNYRVVRNGEEQCSIWLADQPLPLGWEDAGFTGTRQACLEHVEQVWTDMRPLSVRRRLDEVNGD